MTTSKTVIRLWAVTSLILLLFVLNVANAQSVVVGQPTIGGSGCPEGTVSAALAPDGSAISILFDEFRLELPRMSRGGSNKSCRFIIPIQIPQGYVMEAVSIDYRGFMSIAHKAVGTISTSNLFHNVRFGQPDRMVSTFQGTNPRLERDFLISQKSGQSRGNLCRAQNQIDFTTMMTLTPVRGRAGVAATEESLISIDSADLGMQDGPIQIGFKLVPCR